MSNANARLPSLKALNVFRVVAGAESITKAARTLNVSQSAVSRYVTLLEGELGFVLFDRKAGFRLTQQGMTLHASLEQAFSQIETAVELARHQTERLVVKVVPTIAVHLILPWAASSVEFDFHPRWKGIQHGMDAYGIGIRHGRADWPEENLEKIYDEMIVPVGSPGLFVDRPMPTRPEDFSAFQLIHPVPDHGDWRAWSSRWSGGSFDVERGLTFDTLDVAIRAAQGGHGIVVADHRLVGAQLGDGSLVVVSGEVVPSGEAYYLAVRDGLRHDPRVARLSAWLRSNLTAQDGSLAGIGGPVLPCSTKAARGAREPSRPGPRPRSRT